MSALCQKQTLRAPSLLHRAGVSLRKPASAAKAAESGEKIALIGDFVAGGISILAGLRILRATAFKTANPRILLPPSVEFQAGGTL
jgi:adenine/guanine phosphoribosyltransferase-like PRPP-binding protein